MIFRRLQICNFLTFREENTLDFSTAGMSSPALILVLAPNNAGKTSIIKALKFLFYGDDWGGTLANNAAVAEARVGGSIEASVAATIIHRGKEITFRRRFSAIRQASGEQKNSAPILERLEHERTGDRFVSDEGETQRMLHSLVPQALFDFFYFQGETLAEIFTNAPKSADIKAALSSLLHESEWETAIDLVQTVKAKINREIDELVATNEAYSRQRALIANLEQNIATQEEEADKAVADFQQATTEYQRCNDQILALSSGQSFEQTARDLARKQQKADRAETAAKKISAEIARGIGESQGLFFLGSAIPPAQKILEKMREENLLPADVADGFFERLLKRGKCVCGRSLAAHKDSAAREHVSEARNHALSKDVNTGLTNLLNHLEDDTDSSFTTSVATLSTSLSHLLNERNATLVKAKDLAKDVVLLWETLRNSNHEEIKQTQQKQQTALNRKESAAERKRDAQGKIRQYSAAKDKARAELARSAGGTVDYKVDLLEKIVLRSDKLLSLLRRSLAVLKDSFHTILQESVSLHYNSAVTDGSEGWVDPVTLIPAIRINGTIVRNIGGGQRQLLTLAHSVSLAQLRRELHEELQRFGIAMGKLDDQSFFLDSIFAPTDENYSRKIAAFLPGKAHQIVLLLASQQWQEWTRESLEPATTAAYFIQLHSPNPPEGADMKFRGKTVSSYKKLPKGALAFSYLLPIK